MIKFILIGELYYNVNNIETISFRSLKNTLKNEEYYFIIINGAKINIDEKNYYRIRNQFKEIIGEDNIYE